MKTLAMALLAALIGCGTVASPGEQGPPGPPGAPGPDGLPGARGADGLGFHSGDRLRVEGFVYDGGTVMPYAVRDTKFDVICTLARAEDGELRCLPNNHATVRYLDGTCAGAAAAASDCGKPTFAAEVAAPQVCGLDGGGGSVKLVRKVGAQIDPPAKVWVVNQLTGACQDVSDLPAGVWYSLGDVMVGSEFVGGEAAAL